MAKCVKIEAVPAPPPPPATFVLTLSQQEAETLRIIMGWVGGPYSGRRGDTEQILQALRAAGVAERSVHPDYDTDSIYFKDGVTPTKGSNV